VKLIPRTTLAHLAPSPTKFDARPANISGLVAIRVAWSALSRAGPGHQAGRRRGACSRRRAEREERSDDGDGCNARNSDPQLVDAVVVALDLVGELVEPVGELAALPGRFVDLADQVDGGLLLAVGGFALPVAR
jgi:hypothetical protein